MIKELKVYDAIKPRLGEEEAKMLLELIETKVDTEATGELVTKTHLTAELSEFKSEVKAELSEFKSEVNAELAGFKAELSEFKAEVKTELSGFRAEVKTELSGFRAEFANLKTEITSGIIWKVLAISGGQLAILLAILKLFAT